MVYSNRLGPVSYSNDQYYPSPALKSFLKLSQPERSPPIRVVGNFCQNLCEHVYTRGWYIVYFSDESVLQFLRFGGSRQRKAYVVIMSNDGHGISLVHMDLCSEQRGRSRQS